MLNGQKIGPQELHSRLDVRASAHGFRCAKQKHQLRAIAHGSRGCNGETHSIDFRVIPILRDIPRRCRRCQGRLAVDLNKGWTVGKRLLQFERSGIGGLAAVRARLRQEQVCPTLPKYVGDKAGRISDPTIREKVTKLNMNRIVSTDRPAGQRRKQIRTPGAATSIFKPYGAALQQDGAELKRELMGFRGLG